MNRFAQNKKGFTLVEIMTVVALIAILFVIFVPRLDFSTNKVRETGLMTDFRSYQLAFEQVERQNSGTTSFANIDEDDDTDVPTYNEGKELARVINSYLDKKLQIGVEAVEEGEEDTAAAVFTLDIQDPWKEDYVFAWDYEKDALYVVSGGPDKELSGTTADELLDVETEENADNYSISVAYAVDGLTIKTTGFDNNIDR